MLVLHRDQFAHERCGVGRLRKKLIHVVFYAKSELAVAIAGKFVDLLNKQSLLCRYEAQIH